jgi:hypothetical protein
MHIPSIVCTSSLLFLKHPIYILQDTDDDNIPDWLDPDDDGDGVPTRCEDVDRDGDPTNDDTNDNGKAKYLDPLDRISICTAAPALTPVGLVALVSLLSAIAAVAIVRKRR